MLCNPRSLYAKINLQPSRKLSWLYLDSGVDFFWLFVTFSCSFVSHFKRINTVNGTQYDVWNLTKTKYSYRQATQKPTGLVLLAPKNT